MQKTEWLRMRDVMKRTGLSRGKAYQLARSGEVRVAEITPRCLRVDAESLEAWLESKVRVQ